MPDQPPKSFIVTFNSWLASLPNEMRFLSAISLAVVLLVYPHYGCDLSDPLTVDFVEGFEPRLAEATTQTLTLGGSWRVTESAFVVSDSESLIRVQLPDSRYRRVEVRLVGPADSQWAVRVGRSFQNRIIPRVKPGEIVRFEGEMIPGDPQAGGNLTVGVAAQGLAGGGEASLGRIHVRALYRTSTERPLNGAGLLVLPFLPFALTAFLNFSGRRNLRVSAAIGGALTVGAAIALRIDGKFLDILPAAVGALFLAGAAGGVMKRLRGEEAAMTPQAARLTEGMALLGVLAMALSIRWDALVDHWGQIAFPDAQGYLQIAREGSFYRTLQDHAPWIREPLFPAILRGWLALMPDTLNSARFFGALLGLFPIVMTWLVGRRLFSPLVGLLAAGWMATTPYLAQLSIQVLRDDLLSGLVIALLGVTIFGDRGRWWRAVAFGAIGAMLILTRVNFLLLGPLLLIGAAVWRRWHPAEAVLALILMIAPVVPHLQFNASVGDGDPLYSSSVHYRYYANRDNIGAEGFPASFAAWNADPYAGGVMTSGEFLRLYSATELIGRTIRGYVTIFAYEYPHGMLFRGNELVMALGLVGLWGWWRRRSEAWVAIPYFVLVMAPVAFIATITLDYRLATPATAVILWTWAAGAEIVLRWMFGALFRISGEVTEPLKPL